MSHMKCAQLVAPGKPLVLTETVIPDAPPKGIVVKTSFTGICHSDTSFQDYNANATEQELKESILKYPVILGHEISGVVHSLGSEVGKGEDDLKIGDRVLLHPCVGCGAPDCDMCRNGETSLCEQSSSVILGLGIPGGYGAYVSIPDRRAAFKVPENIPMDTAATLSCGALAAYSAVNLAKPTIEMFVKCKGRASLLIVGAGGLGLWCIQLAKVLLPNTIVIVADITEDKLELAKKHGADTTVLWDKDEESAIVQRTKEASSSKQIHVVIDMVNNATTATRAFNCLALSGTLVCVGFFGGSMALPLKEMITTGKKILGCRLGNLAQFGELIKLVSDKQIMAPPREFIRLDDINDAFDRLRAGKISGRCVIQYD